MCLSPCATPEFQAYDRAMRRLCYVVSALLTACALLSCTRPPSAVPAADPRSRSNDFAARLLAIDGAFEPEAISALGLPGQDGAIADFTQDADERAVAAYGDAERMFRAAAAEERNEEVRLDLELLAGAALQKRRRIEVRVKLGIPELEIADVISDGLTSLLDDQVAPDRRAKALVRLRRYAGLEPGTTPLATLAQVRVKQRMQHAPDPFVIRVRVQRYLDSWAPTLSGLGERFAKYGIGGAEEPLARLDQQLKDYAEFVRAEVLPRARAETRRPEELYAFELSQAGIDLPPRELAALARKHFGELQSQAQRAAVEVAAGKQLEARDYREVLRALKKDSIPPDAIAGVYEKRIHDIEAILVARDLISVPKRAMRFRLATESEGARLPAPSYWPPPLIVNHGEQGTFVLPRKTGPAGALDDFSFEAATWWLTAHEGRPGHDLQFSRMVELGVSTARAVYANNSANAEGWGLYAESLIEPYVPAEARLAIVQARLMRAAHAFLDPELNLGLITPQEARRVMTEDVVFSDAWATSSIQRYTVWMPGQAPSYLYGYLRLLELRREAEHAWGSSYSPRRFHDFVISQGLLPHGLLLRAVRSQATASR